MRLVVQYLRKKLEQYDEATFNQTNPIQMYFQILSICSIITKEPIQEIEYAKDIHQAYRKAIANHDKQKEKKYLHILKKIAIQNEPLIKKTLDIFQNINTEDQTRKEVYHPDYWAIASYEDN